MDELQIRSLKRNDLQQMYHAFHKAFSDYQVNYNLDWDTFQRRFLHKLNINFELSVGAFDQDNLVGFIFHTKNEYLGESVLYNGGTGVIPTYRGKGVMRKLFTETKKLMSQHQIKSSVLEVITTNVQALKLYQKVGFETVGILKCFKLTEWQTGGSNIDIDLLEVSELRWSTYQNMINYEPSFIDTFAQLMSNLENETIIEAVSENKVVGFIIFQHLLGRISQIAVDRAFRNKGIGGMLIHEAYKRSSNKQLTVLNVQEEEFEMINFLINHGFKNELDQYEMELRL